MALASLKANLQLHARQDKTVWSVPRRFGGVNWIRDNSRLSLTENLKSKSSNSHRHTRHDNDRTVLSCLVCQCELSRPDKCVQRRSVSGGADTAGATAGRTPTQNALVRRSGRLHSHRPTRHKQHRQRLVASAGRCEFGISCNSAALKTSRNVIRIFNAQGIYISLACLYCMATS